MFDAYHKWLGIPPAEQPPDHYRLLAINRFESDLDVISAAADRQMAYLRSLQSGPHADLSQQLLNELARVRGCLLDPQQKGCYDAVLQSAVPADSVSSLLPQKVDSPPAAVAPAPIAPTPIAPASQAPAPKAPTPKTPASKARAPSAPASTELAIGDSVGSYKLLERTSATPATVCYKAQEKRTGNLVTLKTLTPAAAKAEQVVKRFGREIELTTKLSHANLIVGRDHGQHGGVPYLVLEFVVGMDLASLVKVHGPLPVDQAVEYILQAARGLTQLHLHRVFHRNIKPQVLLVDVQGSLRISDLLLARIGEGSALAGEQEELTQMGQMMGSYDYMPPEQAIDAHQADARSDIYALGCTLYFLLTARPPYQGKSAMKMLVAHRDQPVPSLRVDRPEVPPAVEKIFRKMLAKAPAARYQFMGDVVTDLETSIKEPFFKGLLARLRPSR